MPDGQNWRNATMVARTAVHLPGRMRVAFASGWNGADNGLSAISSRTTAVGGQPAFAGTRASDKVAPIAGIRGTAMEPPELTQRRD